MKHINYIMRFINILFVNTIFVSLLVGSCGQAEDKKEDTAPKNDHLIMATLWHQRAAESMAVSLQAYNLAKIRLDEYLNKNGTSKNPVVIADIDETVLDNSPYEWKAISTGKNYPDNWKEWINLAIAEPIAGAVDFLNYAISKNVQVFYVTNRKKAEKESTFKNLSKIGFPAVDDAHVLFKNETPSKEERRKSISESHEIVLLLGDNLADFDVLFEDQTMEERYKLVNNMKELFGSKFIILPNAMYGDWEGALYNNNLELTPIQKDSIRKSKLIQYQNELSWTISEILDH